MPSTLLSTEPHPCARSDNSLSRPWCQRHARGLDGKTAIVAGGSTLIGQSVAETLAGYGCNVVIADIAVADGEAAAKKFGGKARF